MEKIIYGERPKTSFGGRIFTSAFEVAGVMKYAFNVVRSRLARSHPYAAFGICHELFGKKAVSEAILRRWPEMAEDEDIQRWVKRGYRGTPDLPRELVLEMVSEEFAPLLADPGPLDRVGDDASQRLANLRDTFGLSAQETEIVAFFFLKEVSAILNEYFDSRSDDAFGSFGEGFVLRAHGDAVLGMERSEFGRALDEGALFRSRIIEKSGSDGLNLVLASWCKGYLCGTGAADLGAEFVTRENDEPLDPGDFSVSAPELAVLEDIVAGGKPGNILLFGAAGTGKSSFARSMAKHFGKELLTVRMPEEDSAKDRMAAVYAALNLATPGKSIVLIDESDDILNTAGPWRGRQSTAKSWVNTVMDSHGKQAVWVTNHTAAIDPSTMRRFLFSMEFRKFDPRKRMKVLRYELRKRNLDEGYFGEQDLEALCRDFAVNAAGIVSAIGVVLGEGARDREEALSRIRTMLRNHERAIGERPAQSNQKDPGSYRLAGLNASADLAAVVAGAQRYCERSGKDKNGARPFSLLLYGLPGTGKSEFVYHLGHELGLEVLLKRASDIQSKWVGETEQNIAAAFSEAREEGGILFFDEADSFLFPRAAARESWQVSHTNEVLTQLENHKGIVAFATNDVEGLDHAALRRFRFKVRFDPLAPEGNELFYRTFLLPLTGQAEVPAGIIAAVRKLKNLTPGDFAVVRDQFAFLDAGAATHQQLVAGLEAELRHKRDTGKAIGF